MLRSGRQEADALRKTWRRFVVRHRIEKLSRMRFFDLVPLCGADAIERQATRILPRRTTDRAVPTGIMPRNAHRQMASRHARRDFRCRHGFPDFPSVAYHSWLPVRKALPLA